MIITNNFNLPGPLYRALAFDGYDAPKEHCDITVTQMISAPRKVTLKKRYQDKVTEDASQRIWSLLGHSIHYDLKLMEADDCIVEQRFYMDVGGWRISGQPDVYEMTRVLSDYKITSVYSFLLGAKIEHENQLNLNAMLLRHHGMEVDAVQIVAILRDWMQSRAVYDQAYPQTASFVKPYPAWSQNKALVYAENRIKLHRAAEKMSDESLPPCTEEEIWYRGEAYVVKGEGNKKASPGGTFEVETHGPAAKKKAEAMASEMINKNRDAKTGKVKKNYVVEHRHGKPIMCLSYCPVAQFCNQHQQWLKDHPEAMDDSESNDS